VEIGSERPRDWPHHGHQVERLLLVLMGARLALAVGSFGIGITLDAIGRETPATQWPGFYVAVGLCFVATLVYRPFVGRIERPRAFAAVNVATDLALVSALVLFSGGATRCSRSCTRPWAVCGRALPGRRRVRVRGGGRVRVRGRARDRAPRLARAGARRGAVRGVVTSWAVHASALIGAAGLSGFLSRELLRAGTALAERTQDLEHLRTLHEWTVESLKSGLLTTDLDGRVTSFNQEATRITGLSRTEALGRDLDEVLPGVRVLRAAVAGSDPGTRARMPYTGPGGAALHLGIGAYVLRAASGEAEGEVVIFQDVTEVVAMERELRRSERLAAVGELSASIAHEIRNPLAAISGSIQVMASNGPARAAESGRLMEIVMREVDRLDRLISDFPRVRAAGRAAHRARAARGAGQRGARDVRGVAARARVGRAGAPARTRRARRSGSAAPGALEPARERGPGDARGRSGADRGAHEPRRAPQEGRSSDRMDDQKPVWAEITVMDQGAASPRSSWTGCSTRSSPPRPAAPASVSRSSTA
jgi:PAS domain S-box-containing protein